MSAENVEVVRRLFEASARGDAEAVLALYHEDVTWDASRTQPGLGEFAGVYRGHEGLRRFFREWRGSFADDEYRYEELIDAGGETVVGHVTQQALGRSSGAPVTRPLAGVFTVRDGKIAAADWFLTLEEALDAVSPSGSPRRSAGAEAGSREDLRGRRER